VVLIQTELRSVGSTGAYALVLGNDQRLWTCFHETWCVTLVLGGSAEFSCRGTSGVVRGDQVLLRNPGDLHVVTQISGAFSAFALFLKKEALPPGVGTVPHFGAGLSLNPVLVRSLKRLKTTIERRDSAAEDAALDDVTLALRPDLVDAREPASSARSLAQNAAAVLWRRYSSAPHRPVDIKEVASELGVSYFWFVRTFGKALGVPPYQYVKALRLARTRQLLAAGPGPDCKTLGDVARLAGFSDGSHMSREARRGLGANPGNLTRTLRPNWLQR
jgi:AraC-like DNA-binding protein